MTSIMRAFCNISTKMSISTATHGGRKALFYYENASTHTPTNWSAQKICQRQRRCTKWLFWGPRQINLLSVWHNRFRTSRASASLGKAYRAKWRLCCVINENSSRKMLLFYLGPELLKEDQQRFCLSKH